MFETVGTAEAFLVARVLFGGVLAFNGLNHLSNAESMIPYAESKGVPAARLLVPLTGLQLLAGGVAIAVGLFPVLAAALLALFLLVTTPVMHDFWAASDENRQSELTNFLKNVGLLGGALAFLAVGAVEWPYAVGLGLF